MQNLKQIPPTVVGLLVLCLGSGLATLFGRAKPSEENQVATNSADAASPITGTLVGPADHFTGVVLNRSSSPIPTTLPATTLPASDARPMPRSNDAAAWSTDPQTADSFAAPVLQPPSGIAVAESDSNSTGLSAPSIWTPGNHKENIPFWGRTASPIEELVASGNGRQPMPNEYPNEDAPLEPMTAWVGAAGGSPKGGASTSHFALRADLSEQQWPGAADVRPSSQWPHNSFQPSDYAEVRTRQASVPRTAEPNSMARFTDQPNNSAFTQSRSPATGPASWSNGAAQPSTGASQGATLQRPSQSFSQIPESEFITSPRSRRVD